MTYTIYREYRKKEKEREKNILYIRILYRHNTIF